jgi:rubrerythrin
MSEGITLHPTKGLNPRMLSCVQCGESSGIILLGIDDDFHVCPNCNMKHLGKRPPKCGKCSYSMRGAKKEPVPETPLPQGVCNDCEAEDQRLHDIVRNGGVYFRCLKCKRAGVVKDDAPFAAMVREKMGISAPDPCGVEFTEDEPCPECESDK